MPRDLDTVLSGPARRRAGRSWRWARWLLVWAAVAAIAVKFVVPRALVSYDLFRARRAIGELELTEALAWLHATESRAPNSAKAQFLLGAVYRRSGAFRPARQHLERSLALGYSRKDVERQEWMLRFQMGNITEMEPFLRKLLERKVSNELTEDIYEAMVLGYMADHRVPEAGSVSDLWVRLHPESVRARLTRATMYDAVLSTEKLQSELREILRIDPRRVRQRLRLAQLLLDQKRVDEALVECELCREQAPDDPNVGARLGACYFHLGRPDEAKRELELALTPRLEPTARMGALTILGHIASSEHDFEAAKRYCKEALDLRPYDATAAYGLGLALSKLGEDQLAQKYLKRSQRLLELDQRQVEINLELMRRPDDLPLRLEMARLMVDQGRHSDAAAWMQSVLRYDPKCREAGELLADFYEKHGKHELAQEVLDAAAETVAIETADGAKAVSAAGNDQPLLDLIQAKPGS